MSVPALHSDACIGTILNMQPNTKGIYADDPARFTRWIRTHFPNLKGNSFPPRHVYGVYLSSVLDGVAKDATQLGVTFRVVNDEATDLGPVDDHLEIVQARGTKIQTSYVVLAFGEFPATVHPELVGSPGFFSSPWPLRRLESILFGASVSILGSGLTALDVAIFLTENGHKGPVTFVSRNVRLPKGSRYRFAISATLHTASLARDVETFEGEALGKVLSTIKREVESLDIDTCYECAEDRAVSWQSVVRATAPVIERYWNCMTLKEREDFLRDHMSIWLKYRHAMPVENARKVLPLWKNANFESLGVPRMLRGTVTTSR